MASQGVDKMKRNSKMAANLRRDVPCRVMSKSVDNEEHSFVPKTENYPKFDGVSGCRITTKNKFSGDYRYIYPMLDPDGKIRAVTVRDFHCRICYKYRGYVNYQYVYPVLIEDGEADLTKDNLELLDGWDDRTKDAFVPEEVDRMIPLGIDRVWKSPNTGDIYIVSVRGDIFLARLKTIQGKPDEDIPKPKIRTLLEVNGLADVVYTKKTERAMDRWKRQMEKMASENHCQNRIVYFGNNLDPSEWKDESILDFFAQNYPEDNDGEEIEEAQQQTEELIPQSENGRFSPGKSVDGSLEDEDSGYGERRKASYVSSRLSCDSFNSDEFRNTEESPVPGHQQHDAVEAITTEEDQDEETVEVETNKEPQSGDLAAEDGNSKAREGCGDGEEDCEKEEGEKGEGGSSSASSPSLTTSEEDQGEDGAPFSAACLPASSDRDNEVSPDENRDDIETQAPPCLPETEIELEGENDLTEGTRVTVPEAEIEANSEDVENVNFDSKQIPNAILEGGDKTILIEGEIDSTEGTRDTVPETDIEANSEGVENVNFDSKQIPNVILEEGSDKTIPDCDEIPKSTDLRVELAEDDGDSDLTQSDLPVEDDNSTVTNNPALRTNPDNTLNETEDEIISSPVSEFHENHVNNLEENIHPAENETQSLPEIPEIIISESEEAQMDEITDPISGQNSEAENSEAEVTSTEEEEEENETNPKMDSEEKPASPIEENNNEKPLPLGCKNNAINSLETEGEGGGGDESFEECPSEMEERENEFNLKSSISSERETQSREEQDQDDRRTYNREQNVAGKIIRSPNDSVSEDGASSSEDAFFDSENYFHFPDNGGGDSGQIGGNLECELRSSSNIYDASAFDLDSLEIARPNDSSFPPPRDSSSPTLAFLCSRIVSDNDATKLGCEDRMKVRSTIGDVPVI